MEKELLISHYKKDNDLDIETIIDKYSSYVYTIAKNMVFNHLSNEDIEEIISDTFLALWKNKSKIDENKLLSPYLAGIARNIIKTKFRKIHMDHDIEDYETFLVEQKDIDEIIEQREQHRIINDEIDKMDSQEKEIFTMFYYSSKKSKEIAKELQLEEFNVKMKLHRIRKKLRNILMKGRYGNE